MNHSYSICENLLQTTIGDVEVIERDIKWCSRFGGIRIEPKSAFHALYYYSVAYNQPRSDILQQEIGGSQLFKFITFK